MRGTRVKSRGKETGKEALPDHQRELAGRDYMASPNPGETLGYLSAITSFRDLRSLVVEMVLATDMSCHFEQIKVMKSLLQQPEA